MHCLYPPIKPYACHEFQVDKPHVLYIEETGNPLGVPIMILHPGPGTGGTPELRRFFDPQRYRIIMFDQRGCGRSNPNAELSHNTTQAILDDIDAIRDHLKIHDFILFGSGWGALLALLYAEMAPHQIKALILHQPFLGRQQDIDWFFKKGADQIYPDYWQEFINGIPEDRLENIPSYYNECLLGSNELARMSCAKNWALWQARCNGLHPHAHLLEQYSEPRFALNLAMIESHYINHRYFIEENQVLNNAHTIRHIPSYLIHSRYDMISPLAGAWLLQQAIPASHLRIVRDAGHSTHEAGVIDALILTTQEILQVDLDAG